MMHFQSGFQLNCIFICQLLFVPFCKAQFSVSKALYYMVVLTLQVNAEKVAVSGNKRTQKLYRRHSGRPGGLKVETFRQLQQRIPERIVEHAVRGMLPKGRVSSHLRVNFV